jgi:hypothetical protein
MAKTPFQGACYDRYDALKNKKFAQKCAAMALSMPL